MAAPVFRLGILSRALWGAKSPRPSPLITSPPAPLLAPQGPLLAPSAPPPGQPLHTTGALHKSSKMRWEYLNTKIYKPTPAGEEERPAFVCHVKKNIKYSPDKMWYIACLVRGLQVDDALAQLQFVSQKGAVYVKEALEEAKELAVKEHYVEFPTESFVGRGIVYRGYRRHARRRFGKVEYKHCHYFLTLEEGTPPHQYYTYQAKLAPEDMLKEYLESLRRRNVPYAI